jgi:hypothetical protein
LDIEKLERRDALELCSTYSPTIQLSSLYFPEFVMSQAEFELAVCVPSVIDSEGTVKCVLDGE